MTLIIKIAFRNIMRNAKRNIFTVLSIALGLAFLFWVQCILNGHNKSMIETVTSTFTGDIQIHHEKYLEERQTQFSISPSEKLIQSLEKNGFNWSRRIYFPSIISSGSLSFPLILTGIDPTRESSITKIKNNITSGVFLPETTSCDEKPILISELLAQKLEISLGDKLVILGQDAQGALGNDLFRVSGLFNSKSKEFDKSYSFTTLPCAQSIAAVDGVHEIIIKSNTPAGQEQSSIQKINTLLDEGLKISTWRELVPGVSNMIKFNNAMSNLITFILFGVITLGVINSILMNIFERVREIGIMLAIGTTPTQIRLIILFESFFMAILGAAAGTVIGLCFVLYHQSKGFDLTPFLGKDGESAVGFTFNTQVYPIILWSNYIYLLFIEVIFILVAGLYPAIKASRLKPIDTIRG